MRLLHRINLESVGGVERSFAQFLRGMTDAETSHQVLVNEQVHPFFESALSKSGVRLLRRARFKRWRSIRLPAFAAGLRARNAVRFLQGTQPDSVVAWNCFGNREITHLARALNRPLVYYEHGNGWSHEKSNRRTIKAFLDATRGVVFNSRAAQRLFQLRWGYVGDCALVYCAVGDGYEVGGLSRVVSPGRRVRIGVSGRLVPMKGISLALFMLEALNRDHKLDAELHVAGKGPEEAKLRNLAARLGLVDRVVFHGLVADMPTFYDSVDVQVIPSIQESFGRVSIEAQARGCPVVVTGVDGLPETLLAGESGIVVPATLDLRSYSEFGGSDDGLPGLVYDPQADRLAEPKLADPADLAQAAYRIVGDCESYRRFSETARAQALERFSQREFVSRLHSALVDFAA